MVSFPYPTDSSLLISTQAVNAVKSIYKTSVKYKRAGVIVTGIVPTDNFQLDLFNKENPKHKPLMSAIDTINTINKKYKGYKIKCRKSRLRTHLENAPRTFVTKIYY